MDAAQLYACVRKLLYQTQFASLATHCPASFLGTGELELDGTVLRRVGDAPTGAQAFITGLVRLAGGEQWLVRTGTSVSISPALGRPPAGQPDGPPLRIKVSSSDFGVLSFKVRRLPRTWQPNGQVRHGCCAQVS